MIHVAIVEDNPDIRQGLQLIIAGSEGFTCEYVYALPEVAIRDLPTLANLDVALVDIHLSNSKLTGIDVIRAIKPSMPDVQFMICTVYEDADHIFQAIQAGATGYLLKKTPPLQLLEAIKDVHGGGSPMSGQIARKVIEAFSQKLMPVVKPQEQYALTAREREVLELLSKGLRYKEVADKLFVSIDTVRTHVRNIYEKLQVSSKVEAINKFFK